MRGGLIIRPAEDIDDFQAAPAHHASSGAVRRASTRVPYPGLGGSLPSAHRADRGVCDTASECRVRSCARAELRTSRLARSRRCGGELSVVERVALHWQPTLTEEQAANVKLVGDDIESFWVEAGDETIGLIRVFDLDDIATGSPLLDIRIAQAHRGRGVGTAAVSWIVDHLFSSYNELHRIEATTRHDNRAMQRVFERCGFRLEGRLLEAWANADGSRADTWIFAILRREWSAIRPG